MGESVFRFRSNNRFPGRRSELWIYLKGAWHEAEDKKYPIRASLREVQAALREHPAYKDSHRAHRFRNGATVETKKAWVFDTNKIAGDIEDMLA